MDLSKFESGAAASPPSAPASPSTGYATNGNPATATPATVPGDYWFHQIQTELDGVLSEAGITPDHETLTQLSQALRAMFGFRALQVFTASASWTVPDDVRRVGVLCVGGGGGGAYCAPSSGNYLSGGGGGAGGAALGFYDVTPGGSETVTVGAGGSGGVSGGAAATAGETSSFGSHCSASGGSGATWASATISAGAVGGTGTNGQINLTGGYGTDGQNGTYTNAGDGGASVCGGGPRAFVGTATTAGAYGAGGGGAYSTAASGGAGRPGVVVVLY